MASLPNLIEPSIARPVDKGREYFAGAHKEINRLRPVWLRLHNPHAQLHMLPDRLHLLRRAQHGLRDIARQVLGMVQCAMEARKLAPAPSTIKGLLAEFDRLDIAAIDSLEADARLLAAWCNVIGLQLTETEKALRAWQQAERYDKLLAEVGEAWQAHQLRQTPYALRQTRLKLPGLEPVQVGKVVPLRREASPRRDDQLPACVRRRIPHEADPFRSDMPLSQRV